MDSSKYSALGDIRHKVISYVIPKALVKHEMRYDSWINTTLLALYWIVLLRDMLDDCLLSCWCT